MTRDRKLVFAWALALFLVVATLNGVEDQVVYRLTGSFHGPERVYTPAFIVLRIVFFGVCIVGIYPPLVMLIWNKLITRAFGVERVDYLQAFALAAALRLLEY